MMLLELIAWVSTGLAFVFLVLMILGLDDLFGGMFEARIVAFFGAGLGWGSVLMVENGHSIPVALAAGVGAGTFLGLIALGLVVAIRRASAATEPTNATPIGSAAEVSIAPDGSMVGMVRIVHRGQLTELPALFESAVQVGGVVKVVDSVAGKLKVRAVDSPSAPR